MKNKILAILLTIVMLLSMLPMSAFAADTAPSYVALGDSISTGYGLADKTAEGFTYLLADELGYELTNLAADGNTAAGILAQLQEQSYKDAVADADVITITVGGNDLMALLYSKVAEQTSSTTDTAADIPAKLQSGDYEALVAAINLLTESREMYIVNDEDFPIAINGIIANLNAIITKIRSVNSHAEIVVATQYNPYVEFENAVLAILSLSAVYKGMEAGVNALNTAIVNNAAGKYTVSNVKAAFDAYTGTEDLYNAQPPAGAAAMNVDFHPTAAGHKLLADTFAATFESLDISDAPATVTVEAPYDTMMFAGVTGAGEYEVGESVTLTATTFTDGYDTVFYYWLDNSVELSDYPTEEELKAAIVSYSPTFTFTAAENVSYTPIADYEENKLRVYVEGCLFEDDSLTPDGDGWGYTTEYDQVLSVGDEEITVALDSFPKTLTIEDKLYLRAGFALWNSDGEGEGSLILVEDTSITIPTSPIYNSVEYRNWCNKYASITVAYLLHAHNYETRFDKEGHWEECTCGDKTESEPHHLTDEECTECDYTDHVHSYEAKRDSAKHWEECSCGAIQNEAQHSYSAATCTTPATCSCGATTGEKNPDNHTGGTEIRDVVEATYETEGYTGDTYCLGCGAKLASGEYTKPAGFVYEKTVDGKVVGTVTVVPPDGMELPEDAKLIVKDHTATLAPIDSLLGRDVNTEYLDINDVDITIIENDTYTHPDGTEYRIGEIISINGEEYVISNWVGTGDHLSLTRLSDGASSLYNAVSNVLDFKGSLITTPGEYPFERVNIGGVTYDVVLYFADIEGSGRTTYLYYKGIPVGKMRSGGYYFCKGYDPATLAAQQQDTDYIGTVTPGENPVDGLMSGKTYNVSVIGSNDISVPGYDEALLNSIKVETMADKAAKEELERLKADMEAKWAAFDQLDIDDPNHMEAWGAWYEAETAYKESLAALLNHKKATVTQTFDIPAEFIGNENVKYVAVHETKTGVEYGTVTLAKNAMTLTVTYSVDGFSPFTVYAFVEADEPEIKTLSATVVDGDPTDPGDLDPEPQIDNDGLETWVIVLIVVGSVAVLACGGFAVYWFVIRKKRTK